MKKSKRLRLRLSFAVSMLTAAGAAPALASDDGGMLGDMGGIRTALGQYGIQFDAVDSETLLDNMAGAVKNGATMQGVLTLGVDVDTARLLGLPGGTFHVSALQLHGRPLSPYYLQDLQAANGTEGDNATRLWELWYDQQFLRNRLDFKIGQQSIDSEFLVSTYSGLFVNTMAGWPLIPSVDLYGGGPAYPLSSLGLRLRAEPADNVTVLAGVFDDNPGGSAFYADAQARDSAGTLFNLNTGALWIAEFQYSAKPAGLPGTYKFGGFYDSGHFPDQRFDTDGRSLAAADSDGLPRMHRGNYAFYGVADQTVWQSHADSSRTANLFVRIITAPAGQNLVDFSANGGITITAPLPGRENDTAGIDFGLGRVSSRVADFDRDAGLKRRGCEELVELTYQAQITPWLVVQPDLQYVFTPAGGVPDPSDPKHSLRNAFIGGARAAVTF